MNRHRIHSAMTLVEVLLTLAVIAVGGVILISLLHGVSTLTAKNGAINFAHQEVRRMIHQTVDEIRQSASIPELTEADFTPLSEAEAAGPSAGVAFQSVIGGPYRIWNNTAANSRNIRITSKAGDPPPQPGMRLIVPAFQIDDDIVSVGGFPGAPQVRDLQLAENVGVNIVCNAGDPIYLAYVTKRSGLAVVDGELRHYDNIAKEHYTVAAKNLSTAKPFSVPGGNNRFIQVDLVAQDPRFSRRGYKAVDVKLSLTVPFRYALTNRQ